VFTVCFNHQAYLGILSRVVSHDVNSNESLFLSCNDSIAFSTAWRPIRPLFCVSPSNSTPDVQANSFQHFKNKTVNENHNTRISILDAQLWPCGSGVERKFSTTDNVFETYLAERLGPYLNNEGTARLSIKQ
jgi:hypothetical protein